jgi:hypothetical protein
MYLQVFLIRTPDGKRAVSLTPRLLYPRGKIRQHLLDMRPAGIQSRIGRCTEGNDFSIFSGIEPRFLGRKARSLVSIPTGLSRLRNKIKLAQKF